jgi:hypothetical protein
MLKQMIAHCGVTKEKEVHANYICTIIGGSFSVRILSAWKGSFMRGYSIGITEERIL